jgi:hypothetical protein
MPFSFDWGSSMKTTVEAVYENGVLRLLAPLALAEGQRVQVLIAAEETTQPGGVGTFLAEIAALPVEGSGDPYTSRDHDRIRQFGTVVEP